jgi:hypothetical protein
VDLITLRFISPKSYPIPQQVSSHDQKAQKNLLTSSCPISRMAVARILQKRNTLQACLALRFLSLTVELVVNEEIFQR